MEVGFFPPEGADISAVEKEYRDLESDGDDRYYIGRSSDEKLERGDSEWLDYSEAVEFCGFCQGAVPSSEVMIEGNGGWAQGMISRKDFSSFAISDREKRSYKRTSNRFWKAFERGQKTIKASKKKVVKA